MYVGENQSQTLDKGVETDFIQKLLEKLGLEEKLWYRTELSPRYNRDQWECAATEQGEGVDGWKMTDRRPQG